ncbi:hypothetical protein ISCGN_032815 [Ixodes scapularis]
MLGARAVEASTPQLPLATARTNRRPPHLLAAAIPASAAPRVSVSSRRLRRPTHHTADGSNLLHSPERLSSSLPLPNGYLQLSPRETVGLSHTCCAPFEYEARTMSFRWEGSRRSS